jgi:molybdopterin converting factor small subunit
VTEFNIVINHTTTGKEITVAVEPEFTVNSILEVLTENLQLKDRFVLATEDNKILNPETTIQDAGLKEGSKLLLIPDPTGG